mmetsp:Transcript_44748/g.54785  ORF Transcript_44748/g.54785 Transcript_44748/m.54785 type:complete len:149 (-) Transcript_44748:112-558(-)
MPPKKEQKTKEQKLAAALAGSKKSKKKKWAKGKVREKKDNKTIFNKNLYDSGVKDVVKMKAITVATVSEKLKITGSLAKRFIRNLGKNKQIKKVYDRSGFMLYTKLPKSMQKKDDDKKDKNGDDTNDNNKTKGKKGKGKGKQKKSTQQ